MLAKLFGSKTPKIDKRFTLIVDQVNALEEDVKKLSDEELSLKTAEFKKELEVGKKTSEIRAKAFALVREVAWRSLRQRHYDVQLIGGAVLEEGSIAEMRTGEGKTLMSTLAIYLNALEGKGVHVVTVNEYLAKRDTVWMGQIYHAMGLKVACLVHQSALLYDPE
jgi:preprotein translocase subunit SecA